MRNHLADQSSAYLVQHAEDPVDWRPWGRQAFDTAHASGRPVFLSVGYSSCHWCHVMQRESFRDPKTAQYLNDHFVSVKVDRDERPDVDHLYQQYVAMTAGGSGWPMSVFLDATRRPFYGGTFYPKNAPYNMQSFSAVLTGVERATREDPRRVASVVAESTMVLADLQAPKPAPHVDRGVLEGIVAELLELDDSEWGGLGGPPKYPALPLMRLLLAWHEAWGAPRALDIAQRWMYAMLRGGIFDQAGGGLFRYATDRQWRVPHFEKMLTDNAQLLSAIAVLHRLSPSDELAHAARAVAGFLDRDLARPGGGYWISTDSESQGIEGGAYTWTREELAALLTPEQLDTAVAFLGVGEGSQSARVTIARPGGRAERADEVDEVLGILLAARADRPIAAIRNAVTEANALVARGLLEAGEALGDPSLTAKGADVFDWLLSSAVRGQRVVHMVGDPAVGELDLLSDYAALAAACVASHRVLGRESDREMAKALLSRALELFEDRGALYMTRADTDLSVRPAAYDDVPVASGWVMALEAYRTVYPEDVARFNELFGPLLAFALHAPRAAGATLTLAVEMTATFAAETPSHADL